MKQAGCISDMDSVRQIQGPGHQVVRPTPTLNGPGKVGVKETWLDFESGGSRIQPIGRGGGGGLDFPVQGRGEERTGSTRNLCIEQKFEPQSNIARWGVKN